MNLIKPITMRNAIHEDALPLAKLIDIAGEGIPHWLWQKSCAPDQDPLEVGVERAQRTQGGFSFKNAIVAESQGRIAGMVLSYSIDEAPDDDTALLPAPIAPFVELEKHSVGTWYINALAVFAGSRGRGIGSRLLMQAEQQAKRAGYGAMSIQVYSQNTGAYDLYTRLKYEEVARAPVRQHPCQPYYDEDVVLLIKSLA